MDALRRKVESKAFDRDQPVERRIVRAKHGTQFARADLVQDAERTEGVFWRNTGSFFVQWKLLREAIES